MVVDLPEMLSFLIVACTTHRLFTKNGSWCAGVLNMPTTLWSPDAHNQVWHLCQGCFCVGFGKLSREQIADYLILSQVEKGNAMAGFGVWGQLPSCFL
eukprot:10309092-Ditylum_brightwellii.AAC.1